MRQPGAIFLSIVMQLSLSSWVFADTENEENLRFWEEWNEVISARIRQDLQTPDPWEGLNRKVYAFNDFADRWALTPIAKGYQWITPDPVEQGIGNVFSNLFEVETIVNDLLQFKFAQAVHDTGRFALNSTVGLLGVFDVAGPIGLERNNEDFGQTLGAWGVGAGPYVVIPFFGSYTVRDGFGDIVGIYAGTDLITQIDHDLTFYSVWGIRNIDDRAKLFAAEELITGDRYAFIRDAYLQRREFLVNDGVVQDSFGDEDFEDDWLDDELE